MAPAAVEQDHHPSSQTPSSHQEPETKRYDPNFTQHVIDTCGPNTSPRMKQVFAAAIKHLHNFAREIDLTPEEWMAGVKFMNETGQVWAQSGGKRNEMHRLCDITGLESYVLPSHVSRLTLSGKTTP